MSAAPHAIVMSRYSRPSVSHTRQPRPLSITGTWSGGMPYSPLEPAGNKARARWRNDFIRMGAGMASGNLGDHGCGGLVLYGDASFWADGHFLERLADSPQQRAHVRFEDAPDRTDAKRVGLTDLAWINDEALLSQPPVELRESELRIVRKAERRNDVTLHFRIEINTKAKPPHSRDENFMVAPVARAACGHAAFKVEFLEGFLEGKNRMCRRRVAELAVLLEALPLIEQIQAEAAGKSLTCEQSNAPANYKRKTRYSLNAFVRGGDQIVDRSG